MQPITRGSAQSFCRTCLQDLTKETGEYHIYQEKNLDVWLQSTTDKKLHSSQMQYFPNKLCSACYIKAKVYYEYKQKTYCAGEVIKQVAEEQQLNQMIMSKLANVCRICLNSVQPLRSINIFENKSVLGWLNATSEVKLEQTADVAKWICSKCARKVHINLEFQVLVAQSLEYLKGILELSDDIEPVTNNNNLTEDEEELQEEEPITFPVDVSVTTRFPEVKDEPLKTNEHTKSLQTIKNLEDDIKEEELDDNNCKDAEDSVDSEIFADQFPLLKCEVEINFEEKMIKEENVGFAAANQEETPMEIDFNETSSSAIDPTKITREEAEEIQKKEHEQVWEPAIKKKMRKIRKQRRKKASDTESDENESYIEDEQNIDKETKMNKKQEQNHNNNFNLSAPSEGREVKRDFKYKCIQCARRFSVQWIYDGHMRTHQGDTKPYHCPQCSKKYGQQSQLYRHLYDVHDVPQKPRIPAAISAQIEYKCEFCCKVFKRQDHYRDHVDSVHHLIRRFKCSYCDRSFSLARTMRLHEMRHTGECPYVCETCGRRFRKTTDLKLHMHKHMFPPELICSICHRGKNTAEELKAHIEEHEFKMRHQCPKCGMLFKRASHLVQHDKAVHLKIRPFKCRYCDKAFALHGTTLAHERVHTGERPQICSICGVTYKTKRGLQAHVKRHESEEDPKAPIPKGRRKERKKKLIPVNNMQIPLPPPMQISSMNSTPELATNQHLNSNLPI